MKKWKQNLHDSRINRTKIGLKTVNILICTMIKSVCYKLIKLGTHKVCIESTEATLIVINNNNNNTSNNKANSFTCGWGNSMNNGFVFLFFFFSSFEHSSEVCHKACGWRLTNAIENRELFSFVVLIFGKHVEKNTQQLQ